MAIVGLASGAAGGMLVVQRDKQQKLVDSSSMIQIPGEQFEALEPTASAADKNDANLEVSQPVENQIRVRRNHRRARRSLTREMMVLSNADDEEEESDRDKDDDEYKDQDKKEDDGKKDRGDRNRAVLYDVLRVRKP